MKKKTTRDYPRYYDFSYSPAEWGGGIRHAKLYRVIAVGNTPEFWLSTMFGWDVSSDFFESKEGGLKKVAKLISVAAARKLEPEATL